MGVILPTLTGLKNNMVKLKTFKELEIGDIDGASLETFQRNIDELNPSHEEHSAEVVEQVVVEDPDSDTEIRARILDALEVAEAYASRLTDDRYAEAVRSKLSRSNMRGSSVAGIRCITDVKEMLNGVSNWRVTGINETEKITNIEGILPPSFNNRAFSAHASVREIQNRFGAAGLEMIRVKAGKAKKTEFYFWTTLRFSTNVLTVQLKEGPAGAGYEYLHQWFAGPELETLTRTDDGDTMVRCGIQIPVIPRPHAA